MYYAAKQPIIELNGLVAIGLFAIITSIITFINIGFVIFLFITAISAISKKLLLHFVQIILLLHYFNSMEAFNVFVHCQ